MVITNDFKLYLFSDWNCHRMACLLYYDDIQKAR